jgi:hypothetical protein
MKPFKVAVILPSRGLMFSRTAEDILKNVKRISHKIYFSHGKPIPECFEEPTLRALADDDNTHFWFVEDDMIIPEQTLTNMLWMHERVVSVDYPLNRQGQSSVFRDKGGNVLLCGTGCTLVTREVLEKIGYPIFRTDIKWNIQNYGTHIRITANQNDNDGYGIHDVTFSIKLYKHNIPITLLHTSIGQRKLIKLGESGSNNGAHKIEEWTVVKKNLLLNKIMKYPVVETGDLVSVITPTGEVNTDKRHAKTLIEKGLGVKPPKKYVVIDYNGIEI